ncbi:MAG TPA: hypothetical protein DCM07_31315, partial [Planctomycetaceae bacterium]|nr:hypothetical protein [Planctomycetaceae bacterium]
MQYRIFKLALILLLLPLVSVSGLSVIRAAEPPAPPADFRAEDVPGDAGTAIDLFWTLSPDDQPDLKPRKVLRYVISRKEADNEESKFENIGEPTYRVNTFRDSNCEAGTPYLYQIEAVGQESLTSKPVVLNEPVIASLQWFNLQRSWFAVFVVLICGSVIVFIRLARSGKKLKVRKIAGLEAINDAVGRATEMGRS